MLTYDNWLLCWVLRLQIWAGNANLHSGIGVFPSLFFFFFLVMSVTGVLICYKGSLFVFFTLVPFHSHHRFAYFLHFFFFSFHGLLNSSDFAHEFPLADWGYITHPGPPLMTCASKRVQTQRPSVYKEPFVSVLIYSKRRPYCNFNPQPSHTHCSQMQPDLENHTHASLTKMYLGHYFFPVKIPVLQCTVFQRML